MSEYQDWVFDEYGEHATDSLMEEMDNPVKWYTLLDKYPELMGAQ
jgi:hypothetical protein